MHVYRDGSPWISALHDDTVADAPPLTFMLLPPRELRCISWQYVRLDPEALPV